MLDSETMKRAKTEVGEEKTVKLSTVSPDSESMKRAKTQISHDVSKLDHSKLIEELLKEVVNSNRRDDC